MMRDPVALRRELFGTEHPVAWVTGSAAPRVGRRVLELLAAAGYRMAIHAHQSLAAGEQLLQQLEERGHAAMLVRGAVDCEADVIAARDRIVESFGRIDVLINCAAVWDPTPLEELRAEEVKRQFESNSLGTFLCCQHAGLQMVRQRTGGAIVNVGDWACARPYRDFAAYFASKGALPTITRAFAVELAQRNPRVRVNAVLPGPILLPDDIPEARREALREQALLKREGTPHDLAEAIRFLIEAPFITGICLPVDGGRTIHAQDAIDAIAHPKLF